MAKTTIRTQQNQSLIGLTVEVGGEARAEKVAYLAQRYGQLKQEIEKLKAMDEDLTNAPDGQISLTDPDARAMATSARNSWLVGYNALCAVETEIHVIVMHDVTNNGLPSCRRSCSLLSVLHDWAISSDSNGNAGMTVK